MREIGVRDIVPAGAKSEDDPLQKLVTDGRLVAPTPLLTTLTAFAG